MAKFVVTRYERHKGNVIHTPTGGVSTPATKRDYIPWEQRGKGSKIRRDHHAPDDKFQSEGKLVPREYETRRLAGKGLCRFCQEGVYHQCQFDRWHQNGNGETAQKYNQRYVADPLNPLKSWVERIERKSLKADHRWTGEPSICEA